MSSNSASAGDVDVARDPSSDGVRAAKANRYSFSPANLLLVQRRSLTDHDVLLDDDAKASREIEQVRLIVERHARLGRAA